MSVPKDAVAVVCDDIRQARDEREGYREYRWSGHCRRLNEATAEVMASMLRGAYNPEDDARVLWAREVLRLARQKQSWSVAADGDAEARAGFLLGWPEREPVGRERACAGLFD